MTAHTQPFPDVLEAAIDKSSLPAVLSSLGTICAEKAAHIRECWQDDVLANRWEYFAERIDKLAADAAARNV